MLCGFLLDFQQQLAGEAWEVRLSPGFFFELPLKKTGQIVLQGSAKTDIDEKRNKNKAGGGGVEHTLLFVGFNFYK